MIRYYDFFCALTTLELLEFARGYKVSDPVSLAYAVQFLKNVQGQLGKTNRDVLVGEAWTRIPKEVLLEGIRSLKKKADEEQEAELQKARQPLRDPVVRETMALRREVAAMKHRLRRQ